MDQTSSYDSHAVAVYQSHDAAESAVRLLNQRGFDMKQLSVIGQNYHSEEHPIGFVNTGDRMLSWGGIGAFWGAIWGLLFGSAMVFLPGIGYVMFAGWIVSVLTGAVTGGAVGAVAGALASIGVPKDSVVRYESALKAGSFLLIAHGDQAEVQKAKDILGETPHVSLDTYGKAGATAQTVQATVR